MTKLLAALSMMALAGTVLSGTANAADLDQVLLKAPELPMTKPVEVGTGWYLRGDLGYSLDTSSGSGSFDSGGIDSDWSGSAGFGYHFNDFLRSDLTVEYAKGSFSGSSAAPCGGAAVGGCSIDDRFKSWGFMLNGYVDLGTYAGFTPYAGGGVGYMNVSYQDAENSWRFAYQLSAGVAYALTRNLKLDLGYRYLDVDGGKISSGSGTEAHDDGFSKQEIRAGLRYDIW